MVGTRFGPPPRACFKRETEIILHRSREKCSQNNREDIDRTKNTAQDLNRHAEKYSSLGRIAPSPLNPSDLLTPATPGSV